MPDQTPDPVKVIATVPIAPVAPDPDAPRPPWLSEKIWLAIIGLAALVTLGALGIIQIQGIDIAGLIGALILGRAWEGVAAAGRDAR